jgi:hypothetical protein
MCVYVCMSLKTSNGDSVVWDMCWGCSKTRTAGSSPDLHASVEMPRVLSVSRPMSSTEVLRIQCRSRNRTAYVRNILDSTQDKTEALTSPFALGRRGLFPRCVKRTGHEAGHSPPTSDDVKNESRSTSTTPYFFMTWCLIRYMDRPDNLSQCHRIPQQEEWGNTACKQALQKMTQCA